MAPPRLDRSTTESTPSDSRSKSSPHSLDEDVHETVSEHEVERPLDIDNPRTLDEDYIRIALHGQPRKMDYGVCCGVCTKSLTQEDGPHCPSCVRNMLYGVRLELARVLMEKEELGKQVEAITAEEEPAEALNDELQILRTAYHSQVDISELQQIIDETAEIERQTTIVKKEVELKKAKVKEMRENLDARKANLLAAKRAEKKGQQQKLEQLKEATAKLKADHDAIHTKVIDAKATLCREAASLLRLQHSKKKTKEGTVKDRYFVAGLPLPDLKDINNMRCTDLTAALDSTARLVVLCAFYLGVRLPAEITLPHRDYPLPTINAPLTSYFGTRTAFPGSGSSLSAPSSPSASRVELSSFPRPRPLYFGSFDHNEVVAQFAKKESLAFSFFLEGISLLAWDIAWLSRTQGFVQGTETWEDVCDIGRNLYQLILAPPQSAATFRILTERDLQIRQHRSQSTSTPATDSNMLVGRLGTGSHTSAHTFLGAASSAGDNPVRYWRLNKHTMVGDPLKKHLLGEMNNAEWELLDEGEWDDGGEKMDDAVLIKTRAMDGKDYDDSRSIMTANKVAGGEEDVKAKGTSGWTKVKSRDKP